jgi:hypothetical protein
METELLVVVAVCDGVVDGGAVAVPSGAVAFTPMQTGRISSAAMPA